MNDMSPPVPSPSPPAETGERIAQMRDMLGEQTRSLDSLFTRLMGEAEENVTDWPVAAETYARLAFRAQWNCRAAVESMVRIHRSEAMAALAQAQAGRLDLDRDGDGQ